jgi:glycine C-acetyltransferase/8-amino-7-oxononanoate synthase
VVDLDDRLDELAGSGLYRRSRMVSGPQGPRVVLDGRPVLVLCSGNALGLADHPRVRQAAAEAAMRWGVGAGAPRGACGTMTLHRRLEERLAGFAGTDAAVLFGSGTLANLGVIGALARRGEVVFHDARCHPSIADACRLAGAEAFVYGQGDTDRLAWGLRQAAGRAALIATDGVFAATGEVAPLRALAALARRHRVRLLVDEAAALGAVGPEGRGAVAAADVEDEVDVVTGSLGKALGSYGGFACCDHVTARYLLAAARPLLHSTALPPVAAAAALAALGLLEDQPRLVERLETNAATLRDGLTREGLAPPDGDSHIVTLPVGTPAAAARAADAALEQGVLAEPAGPALRLAVMASHARRELRDAAAVLAGAVRAASTAPAAQALDRAA